MGRLTELEDCINRFKIDVFCSHSVTRVLPMVLLCKVTGMPLVLELHGIFTTYVASRHALLQPRDKNHKIIRLADATVVLSRVFETFWRNLGCNAHYIPNPLPLSDIEFKRDPMVNRKVILWVGRIVEAKGIRAIVPIMREVVRREPQAKLRVLGGMGDEDLFNELLDRIRAEGFEDHIEFCGFHLDVRSFYESADVMLTTSPSEGFSFTIAESKLYSLPLVCYEMPYLELLRDGRGFISVRQGDAIGAAAALVEILNDDRLRVRLSKEARESVEPFLEYDFAGAWKMIFDEAFKGRRVVDKNFEVEQIERLLLHEIWHAPSDLR